MPRYSHKKKKSLVGSFLEYGFHLWILLFVSNLLIFYSFSFFSFGAEDTTKSEPPTPTVAKTPKFSGPVISLSFSLPGIGSNGGTLRPARTKRNVTVYLYATDVNSNDNKVKPLYSIKTTAEFDANELSPTYTAFINPQIDLGDTVKNGKYQIAFITDQSLRKLVKEKEDSIGGQIVNVTRFQKVTLPLQRVIMGDMAPPSGNNIMDINDYNILVECFGKLTCNNFRQADLNDDGIIDGIDYNIMALGFKTLVAQGQAPPQLPTPKPTQVKRLSELKATPKPSPTAQLAPSQVPTKTTSSGNPLGALLGVFFFILILGGAGFFVATRTPFGKALRDKLAKKTTTAPEPATVSPPTAATPEAIAASTEIPIAEAEAAKNAPAETPASTDPNTVDKTYYVKNKSKDDKGTWVTLTDDAGPIDGLLPTGEIEDGFERIKGKLIEENGKKYVLIQEILPSE